MQCPYCGGDAAVLDSRTNADAVRRRRSCSECKRRFTTYERVASPSVKVIKRSGKTEGFDFSKIVNSIMRVGRDRPKVGLEAATRIARTVEAQLVDNRAKSVLSSDIANQVLALLAELDRLAYDRLAANYLDESGQLRTDAVAKDDEDTSQLGLFREE